MPMDVNNTNRKIALFDLDDTLVDYQGQLLRDLQGIASEYEPQIQATQIYAGNISYLEARRHVITSQVGWWRNLPKLQLGWDILEVARELGYFIAILTKGPSRKHAAWSEKIEWCNEHLTDYIDGVTITHDKGIVYGAVLVDDWPDYVTSWLEHRPRGLVVMPAHNHNAGFMHPQVVRYGGRNMNEIRSRMRIRFSGKEQD